MIITTQSFVVLLEICSLFSILNKIYDGPKRKWLFFLCILRWNFVFILGPCLFWFFSTGTIYTIFTSARIEPSWGIGLCTGSSLACLLTRLHYRHYKKKLDRRRNINRFLLDS